MLLGGLYAEPLPTTASNVSSYSEVKPPWLQGDQYTEEEDNALLPLVNARQVPVDPPSGLRTRVRSLTRTQELLPEIKAKVQQDSTWAWDPSWHTAKSGGLFRYAFRNCMTLGTWLKMWPIESFRRSMKCWPQISWKLAPPVESACGVTGAS